MSAAWLLPHCNPMCRSAFATLLGVSVIIVLLLIQRLYKRLLCRGSRHLNAPFTHKDVCSGTPKRQCLSECAHQGRHMRVFKPTPVHVAGGTGSTLNQSRVRMVYEGCIQHEGRFRTRETPILLLLVLLLSMLRI